MLRRLRRLPGGTVFHVLNRGVGRQTLFHKDEGDGNGGFGCQRSLTRFLVFVTNLGQSGQNVDGAVRRIGYAYDDMGRVSTITSYDAATSGNAVNQIAYTYDGWGNVVKSRQEHAGVVTGSTPDVEYRYEDGAASGEAKYVRLSAIVYPDGRIVRCEYSAGIDSTLGQLSFLADDDAGAVGTHLEEYAYLGLGTVVERRHPESGVDLTYIDESAAQDGRYAGLDRFGRIIEQNWTDGTTSTDDFRYAYDRNGNRLYKENVLSPANSELYHASGASADEAYDGLNRLTGFARGTLSASVSGGILDTSTNTTSREWDLDSRGNWESTSATLYGQSQIPQVREHNEANQILSAGGLALEHDAAGNLTLDDKAKDLRYDAWNRLVGVSGMEVILDPTFGNGGSVTSGFGYDPYASSYGISRVAIQADGSVLLAGTTGSGEFLVASFSSTGSGQFFFTDDFNSQSSQSVDVAMHSGSVLVLGEGESADIVLGRLNTYGVYDTSFGSNGVVSIDVSGSGSSDHPARLAVLSSGKILVLGQSNGNFVLLRLNSNGSLDTSFGTQGKTITTFGSSAQPRGLTVQPDGRIVAVGGAGNQFAIARYNADGSPDDGTSSDSTPSDEFGTDGKVLTSIQSGGTAEATAVTLLPDGRILVAGSCWGFAVARYTADGVLDSSFGIGGKVTVSDTGMARSISAMPDGRIIVAGSSNYSEDFQVACLNPDGSLFEQASIRTDLSGGSDYAESIALSQDGKVVVAGASQIVWEGENGTESKPAVGIARYGVVFERAYRYDGLGRRIVASDEAPTYGEEHFYHSEQWQVLQDSAAQYVWSPVYVDAMVLRDGASERLYVQQDAQYNVTAIVSVTGEVLERYIYEAYGSFIVLNPDWSADEDTASDFAWRYLHQGGFWDPASALYHFRNRDYSPTLGRWVQPDPKGYIDGMSLYEYVRSTPQVHVDPQGLWVKEAFLGEMAEAIMLVVGTLVGLTENVIPDDTLHSATEWVLNRNEPGAGDYYHRWAYGDGSNYYTQKISTKTINDPGWIRALDNIKQNLPAEIRQHHGESNALSTHDIQTRSLSWLTTHLDNSKYSLANVYTPVRWDKKANTVCTYKVTVWIEDRYDFDIPHVWTKIQNKGKAHPYNITLDMGRFGEFEIDVPLSPTTQPTTRPTTRPAGV